VVFETESPTHETTVLESDACLIRRDTRMAFFSMFPARPLKERFVHITQPTLFTRARRAELNYGNYSKLISYMTAFEDVLIKETHRKPGGKAGPPAGAAPDEPSLKYATGGRADFDARKDIVTLTEFPQVYQDKDTVTGEKIILHRDSDVVEVEHSNAYTSGQRKDR
jgi:hypothetical protein